MSDDVAEVIKACVDSTPEIQGPICVWDLPKGESCEGCRFEPICTVICAIVNAPAL